MLKELKIDNPEFVKKLTTTTTQIFKKFLKNKNCYCIGDKAFIYLLTNGRGDYNVITPKIPRKEDDFKNQILNTTNANYSRTITSIRNVVESIILRVKATFEKLTTRLELALVPHLEVDLKNFALFVK